MQILVSGSLAYDRIMDFPGKFSDHIMPDKIHVLNVCFMVNGLIEKFGGTAGNIAYSLSLLGEKPVILATSGKDFENYEKWLKTLRLPLNGIRHIADEFTSGAYITTDKADNQITGFNPGAMKYPSHYDFNGVNPLETLAIVAPGNLDDMLKYSGMYKERKIPYIFDPGQSITSFTGDELAIMINGSMMLISNDYELEMIKKQTRWDISEILDKTGLVITTMGEEGAVIKKQNNETMIPASKVSHVADPTGAGDAFRAGLIKGLVAGKHIEDAAALGSTCASYAVEKYGTQEHKFTMEEFLKRHKDNFGAISFP